jgi:hypothetical protein
MRLLNGILQTMQTTVTSLSQQVGSLQARLSASSQDDLSLALQNITSTLATAVASVSSLNLTVSNLQALVGVEQDLVVTTGAVPASSTAAVSITWPTPFADNTYSVGLSMEDSTGDLTILGFSYQSSGVGITVNVANSHSGGSVTGNVHTSARANSNT